MRECVLKKQVGMALDSWVARFDDLAERKEYVREVSAKAAARASYRTPVGPLGAEGGSPGRVLATPPRRLNGVMIKDRKFAF